MVFSRLRRFLRRVFRRDRGGHAPTPAQAGTPAETAQELVLRAGRAAVHRRGELVPLRMEGEDCKLALPSSTLNNC